MKRVAIYTRQSLERDGSVSIETQVEKCKQYFRVDDITFEVFEDKGYSGKNLIRPSFERLYERISNEQFDIVVAYRLDRISRSVKDFANLLDFLEKHHTSFISATENFDTSTPIGRAMVYFVMVFAQLERETTVQRITDNYRYRAKQKNYMGGNPPYGYKLSKELLGKKSISKLIIDETAREHLKFIFAQYLNKSSIARIAKDLNSRHILTTANTTWTRVKVQRVLSNIAPVQNDAILYEHLLRMGYLLEDGIEKFDGTHGMLSYFKEDRSKSKRTERPLSEQLIVIGEHEPLISSRDFILVQKLLSNTAENPKEQKKSKRTYLAGLLSCEVCKKSFGVKTTKRGDKEYSYYFCRGRLDRGKDTCSNDTWINYSDLEDKICNHLKEYIVSYLDENEPQQAPPSNLVSEEVNVLNRKYFDLQQQIDNLVNTLAAASATLTPILDKKITILDEESKAILTKIDALQINQFHGEKMRVNQAFAHSILDTLDIFETLDIDQKSDFMRLVVKCGYVNEAGDVRLDFTF